MLYRISCIISLNETVRIYDKVVIAREKVVVLVQWEMLDQQIIFSFWLSEKFINFWSYTAIYHE